MRLSLVFISATIIGAHVAVAQEPRTAELYCAWKDAMLRLDVDEVAGVVHLRTSEINVPRPGPIPFVIDQWLDGPTGIFVELSFAQSSSGYHYFFNLSYFHPINGEPFWAQLSEQSVNRSTGEQFASAGYCFARADLAELLEP